MLFGAPRVAVTGVVVKYMMQSLFCKCWPNCTYLHNECILCYSSEFCKDCDIVIGQEIEQSRGYISVNEHGIRELARDTR